MCFDPAGREHALESSAPIFYLVRRGGGEGTIDRGLLATARDRGAEVRFGESVRRLKHGGIIAEGPHFAEVIAAGHVFETDMADGCYAAVSDRLAPKGYAYVLINRGRGTVAVCLFEDFHSEREYLSRAVEFFRERIGLRWLAARRFGGSGTYALPTTAQRSDRLYAGEAAGFQDALFGFGLRFAMTSGALAGCAAAENSTAYDRLWHLHLGGQLRAGHAGRKIYRSLGDRGYRWVLEWLVHGRDPRRLLSRIYAPKRWKNFLAGKSSAPVFGRADHPKENCDCTWCRCARGDSPKHEIMSRYT